jgi:hypothetical protein
MSRSARTPRVAVVLLLGACAPVSGPVTVEALVHDPSDADGTRLGDVVLETVTDLSTGEGELFSLRGGLRMAGVTVQESVDEGDDYDEMVERCRGDGGRGFASRMHHDGERWIAHDLETLTAFTAFGALEAAYARARASGDEDGSAPGAYVGITAEVVAADLFPIPILTSDNAAYAPPLDGWLLLRVGLQQGVPFAMSLPVLAHEFGHRLFFRNTFRREEAFNVWVTRTDGGLAGDRQRANRILQGLDEGLADLFSLGVTGDVDGIPRAFRQAGGLFEAEATRRHLEGDFADAASYDGLNDLTLDAAFLEACGAGSADPLFEQETFNFYCLGTLIARALWDASARDVEVLRDEVLPAVVVGMREAGDTIGSGTIFDAEHLLQPIALAVSEERRALLCSVLAVRFTSVIQQGRVPACP